MRLHKTTLALCLVSALLAACGSTGKKGVADGAGAGDGLADASTSGYKSGDLSASELGYGAGAGTAGDPFNDPASPLSKRVIYFMFDSSEVRPEFVPVISAHASYIGSNPDARVILEGHADERGSREYNIALGEQRAKSVARMLQMNGVSNGQIDIVSYGEEKPAVFGDGEAVWEQNRRVEFVYQ